MKNKHLEKVRKLLAKANDPSISQQEMETFLAAAQRLQIKYNIESSSIEIDLSDFGHDEIEVNRGKREAKYYEGKLLSIIANFNNCKVLYDTFRGKIYQYKLVGTLENRQIVKELFEICITKFRSYAWPRYKEYQISTRDEFREALFQPKIGVIALEKLGLMTSAPVFIESYLNGTLRGLKDKLEAEKEKELHTPEAKEKWGLIVVRNSDLVDEYTAKAMGKIGKIDTNKRVKKVEAGYIVGMKDGNSNHGTKELK